MAGRSYAGSERWFHGLLLGQRVTFPTGATVNRANSWIMRNPNNSVAVRTLIMAGVLIMGLVATMLAKGLISTAILAS